MTTLQDVKDSFKKFFYLTNYNAIDAILGVAVANLIPGPSLSMYVIAPSGSGKSDIVNGFEKYNHAYMAGKLTAHTLTSGFIEEGKKRQSVSDKSLLVRLKAEGRHLLVLKDFTTVLEMPSEARQTLFSQFREVTDGKFVSDCGTGDGMKWEGKLGILAACTSAIDQHSTANNILGERFLSFRLRREGMFQVYDKVLESSEDLGPSQAEYARLVSEFLLPFDLGVEKVSFDPGVREALMHLCSFIAFFRTGVHWNPWTKLLASLPEPEGYGRISRQMQYMGSGIALVRGENMVNWETYKLLKKIARDTIPQIRGTFLSTIYNNPGTCTARDLVEASGIPYKNVNQELVDLELIKILGSTTHSISGKKGTHKQYHLTTEVNNNIRESGVFHIDYME